MTKVQAHNNVAEYSLVSKSAATWGGDTNLRKICGATRRALSNRLNWER